MDIEDAAEAEQADNVTLAGFLLGCEGAATLLCFELLDSFPPQCGAPFIEVVGMTPEMRRDLSHAEGCWWSERPVTLRGDVRDGKLVLPSGAR